MAKVNPRVVDALLVFGIIAGLFIVSLPVLMDIFATQTMTRDISHTDERVSAMSEDRRAMLLENARRYNAYYATDEELDPKSIIPYQDQLNCSSDGMMGWLEIDKINLVSTIYHGADEATLATGAGHLEGTSLPVGGPSTHCVISAHSGSVSSRMFDEIRNLEGGDIITLHVLGDTLNYRVYASEVVLPEAVQPYIQVEQGRDLLTLLTCTPYGVNTHRLLIHAERTDEVVVKDTLADDMRESVNERTVPVFIVAAVGMVIIAALAITRANQARKKKKTRSKQENAGL